MQIDKHSIVWFLVKSNLWFEEKKKAASERRNQPHEKRRAYDMLTRLSVTDKKLSQLSGMKVRLSLP
jgi:hypothetical protein